MRDSGRKYFSVKKLALMGMLFALAMALAFIESLLPALPMLPQGVKLGLSNIVTMYCLFFLGRADAFTIAFLKSAFVTLIRGPVGGLISFSGGVVSVLIMALLMSPKKLKLSYLTVSIAGAVFHNIGQLIAARIVIGSPFVFYYIPVMVVAGIVMGILTGAVLKVAIPYIGKIDKGASDVSSA